MKKILFIDRDGTLVLEPDDEQIDSLEKLEFYPEVFTYLGKISKELDYELVMVTNQDGLGTKSFPEEFFWPAHNKLLNSLKNEGVIFSEIFIDRSFPNDNASTRKPRTGMLTNYLDNSEYNLSESYVIGDRISDMELAKNLNSKGILIVTDNKKLKEEIKNDFDDVISLKTNSWSEIYSHLKLKDRVVKKKRKTNETDIVMNLNLDGKGKSTIDTGISFFDHMLDQLARHGGIDLDLKINGDLDVDEHHTIEDAGITLGEAFHDALGEKIGIERYGFCLPMDDCLAQVSIDFGGRSWLVWEAEFKREMIGKMPTEMFMHFFKSFCDGAKANLNIKAEGKNEHHKIEAIFKAFARTIKQAIKRDPEKMILPSTKGNL
ncbi:MAG: bifunctional histidinol-phosphatase/imidazoleglycerol-phosphate dehydratase HisB [Bacteroidota bacterium]|nr:bifunctional histidinol-phosphatase/imidazoleglycerol-phosphate dehydratase HisB [Bacteroidota bacterium]